MILLSSSFESFIQLLGVLVIFIMVLLVTYFTTKWIGSYQQINMLNKNLQVIESVKVGTNKFICLVKTGKIYLAVAVGKDEITLLAQLTEEQLSEVPTHKADAVNGTTDSFANVLEKMKGHFSKK